MSKLIFSGLLFGLFFLPSTSIAAAYPASPNCLQLANQRLSAGPYPGKKSGFILDKIKHLQKNNCFLPDKAVRPNSKLCYKLAGAVKHNWRKENKWFNTVILLADRKYQIWRKIYRSHRSAKVRSKALKRTKIFKRRYIKAMKVLQQSIRNSRIDGQDYLLYENVKRSRCATAMPGVAFTIRKNQAAFYISSFVYSTAMSRQL